MRPAMRMSPLLAKTRSGRSENAAEIDELNLARLDVMSDQGDDNR